jgi:hypothetical protein
MQLIHEPRAAGKTTKMMKWLMEDSTHVLIVFSTQEKQRIIKEYAKEELNTGEQLPLWVERIYTPFEYSQRHGRFTGKEVLAVDNADMVLEYFLRKPVAIASITAPTPEPSE